MPSDVQPIVGSQKVASTVRVDERDLRILLAERDQLRAQVTELQTRMGELVERTLPRYVRAFHLKYDQPIAITPGVPDEPMVRFRLALIIEEFAELMSACVDTDSDEEFGKSETVGDAFNDAVEELKDLARLAPLVVDLPELTDAMTDLDYVIEGTRAVFGIDGRAVLEEVQRANMAKDAVYVDAKDEFKKGRHTVKPTKPEGWRPPDIAAVLKAQGWRGFDGRRVGGAR